MRWIRRILIFLLVIVIVVAGAGVFFVQRAFPETNGEIIADGLESPVRVIRDTDGVPHVYAENTHDLYFAQGFVHAQDRFFQMDFWRHIGAGRLSEMFGSSQVDTDKFLRALGFADIAAQELDSMDAENRQILQAYAEGVNAYLETHSPTEISFEYALLPLQVRGYEIEPWSPINTLTWAKVMAWDLRSNLDDEVERTMLSKTLPADRIEQLYPAYPADHPVVVPGDQVTVAAEPAAPLPEGAVAAVMSAGAAAEALGALTGGGFEGIGSNNWVVGGSLTSTGAPILANDPHLAIQMPSIWYEIGLHCTGATDCQQDVAGFGFAGVPGVVVGHNERIAWGVTNEAVDTQDLYVERLNPDDPDQYEVDGEWAPVQSRTETIAVGGSDPVTYQVRTTRHGPIISDIYLDEGAFDDSALDLPERYEVALDWQALQPSTLIAAIIGINRASNYDEFRAAAADWDIAPQNLVYADVEGNIAYQSTGEVPIRGAGDGRNPVPGWDTTYDWVGTVPFEEMPRLYDPPRDYVASANQPVTRVGEGPFDAYDAAYGYRAARIEEMIQSRADHTVESIQAMQMDTEDGGALNLVPYLLGLDAGDATIADLQAILRSWSQGGSRADGGSPGAALYEGTWRHLLSLTFEDDLPEDSWPTGGSRWFEVVRNLLPSPDDPYWDDTTTTTVETRDDILRRALLAADSDLTDLLGADRAKWAWGDLHRAVFRNQTFGESGIAPIEWLFNRAAPPRVGGTESVVNAVGWTPTESGYEVDWLPSFRMVIDLADLSRSTAIHTTGQSGHAFAGHYDDMIEPWTDGDQRPMRWTDAQVEQGEEATLALTPSSG
jgi:penicillin G amidase